MEDGKRGGGGTAIAVLGSSVQVVLREDTDEPPRPTLFSEQTGELILITGKILNHRPPSAPSKLSSPLPRNDRAILNLANSFPPLFERSRAITRRLIMQIIM